MQNSIYRHVATKVHCDDSELSKKGSRCGVSQLAMSEQQFYDDIIFFEYDDY